MKLTTKLTVKTKVLKEITKRGLLSKGDFVLIAVSGGQDSLCLLNIIQDLSKDWSFKVIVAHCDHKWETDVGIANHVERIVKSLGLPYYLKEALDGDMEKQSEDSARKWRYKSLTQLAREHLCTVILTGHTLTDQVETLLHNLARGSGVKGLTGMPWKKTIGENLQLVRPMLSVTREETAQVCIEAGLDICEDVLNNSEIYTRCRIRHQVIPLLKSSINQAVETNIAHTANILMDEEDYLHQQAYSIFKECTKWSSMDLLFHNVETPDCRYLYLKASFLNAHIALRKRVIKMFLDSNCSKATKYQHVTNVLDLIAKHKECVYLDFPNQESLEYKNDVLIYHKRKP